VVNLASRSLKASERFLLVQEAHAAGIKAEQERVEQLKKDEQQKKDEQRKKNREIEYNASRDSLDQLDWVLETTNTSLSVEDGCSSASSWVHVFCNFASTGVPPTQLVWERPREIAYNASRDPLDQLDWVFETTNTSLSVEGGCSSVLSWVHVSCNFASTGVPPNQLVWELPQLSTRPSHVFLANVITIRELELSELESQPKQLDSSARSYPRRSGEVKGFDQVC
jgi:hypothetical protein